MMTTRRLRLVLFTVTLNHRLHCANSLFQIGGKPGIATLVVGVCVGLFVQNWDRGFDVFNLGLELIGMGPETSEPPPPARGAYIR